MRRKDQEMGETDCTWKEYTEAGFIWNDYHTTEDDLAMTCEYDFLKHLNVGDVIQPTLEETGNLAPWIISVELDEDYTGKLLVVTRKIYSAGSLDVYVDIADDDFEIVS